MIAKKTSKNQLTLPKKIVDRFPDVDYFDVRVEGDLPPEDGARESGLELDVGMDHHREDPGGHRHRE